MRDICCLVALLACIPASAQDFTMEGGHSATSTEAIVDVLIAPFNEMYMISEIDKLLTDDGVEPQEMRAKLRTYLMRRIDERFSDSLRTRNMLLADDDMLDYLYNGTDHVYKELTPKEEEGDTWLKRKLKKKEEDKVYGSLVSRQDGQIERAAILHDRYMSARLANAGMVEYMQDSYRHRYMLYITQLEIRRDTEKGATIYGETDYTVSVHFSVLDAQGSEVTGGRLERSIDRDSASVPILTNEVFSSMADELFESTTLYLGSPAAPIVADEDDY